MASNLRAGNVGMNPADQKYFYEGRGMPPPAPPNEERQLKSALGQAAGSAALGSSGPLSVMAPGAGGAFMSAAAPNAAAAMLPMLGPLALAALPFMFKQGTEKVKKKENYPSYMDMASSAPIFKTYGPRLDHHAAKQDFRRVMPSSAWADHDDIEMIFELSPEDERKIAMGIPLKHGTYGVKKPMGYSNGTTGDPWTDAGMPTPMESAINTGLKKVYMDDAVNNAMGETFKPMPRPPMFITESSLGRADGRAEYPHMERSGRGAGFMGPLSKKVQSRELHDQKMRQNEEMHQQKMMSNN